MHLHASGSGLTRSRSGSEYEPSSRAVQINILIMRAFVRLRTLLSANKELARHLDEIEAQFTKQWGMTNPGDIVSSLGRGSAPVSPKQGTLGNGQRRSGPPSDLCVIRRKVALPCAAPQPSACPARAGYSLVGTGLVPMALPSARATINPSLSARRAPMRTRLGRVKRPNRSGGLSS
jgi:hypothetical protein